MADSDLSDDDGFLVKVMTQATVSATFVVVACSDESIEQAAAGIGMMLVMAGTILQRKKPGLARAVAKSGAVAIAVFAVLLHMADFLPPVMAWVFWLLAAFVVAAAAALA